MQVSNHSIHYIFLSEFPYLVPHNLLMINIHKHLYTCPNNDALVFRPEKLMSVTRVSHAQEHFQSSQTSKNDLDFGDKISGVLRCHSCHFTP